MSRGQSSLTCHHVRSFYLISMLPSLELKIYTMLPKLLFTLLQLIIYSMLQLNHFLQKCPEITKRFIHAHAMWCLSMFRMSAKKGRHAMEESTCLRSVLILTKIVVLIIKSHVVHPFLQKIRFLFMFCMRMSVFSKYHKFFWNKNVLLEKGTHPAIKHIRSKTIVFY